MGTSRLAPPERLASSRAPAVALMLILAVATLQCGEEGSPTRPSPQKAVSMPGMTWALLDELLGVMRKYSANAGRIDWDAFRAAMLTAAGAESAPNLAAAVVVALRLSTITRATTPAGTSGTSGRLLPGDAAPPQPT